MRKYLFRGVVAAVAMAAVTIAVSCADDGNDGASGGNGNGGAVKYELSDVVKVFGFDGQNRYAYCPSVMATDDMTHMWFCGNPDENVFVDNIYHVTVASDGTVSAPVSVLQPGGPGEWDSQHVCDPSVGAPRKLVTEGFWNLSGNPDYTRNMDFVYDPVKSTVYAVRPLNPCPASYPSYIGNAIEVASITYTNFKNGFGGWARMLRVDSSVTGFPRTHNAALERDGYGQLFSDRTLDVYYTVSKASPDVEPSDGMHAEWTYDIYRGTMNLE